MGVAGVVRLAEEPRENAARRHATRDCARYAGQEKGDGKDVGGVVAQQRLEHGLGLREFVHVLAVREEGTGRQQYHGGIDGPAHDHGEEGVDELVFQHVADARVALEMNLTALHDLGMQEEIVGHDHGAQHAHDDEQRPLGHRWHERAAHGHGPVDVDQEQLVDERQPDHRHEADDGPLHLRVTVGEEHDEHGRRRQHGAGGDGDSEEHLQGDGTAQDLGQRRGDTGQDGRHHDGTPQPAGRVLHGGLAQA